MTEHLRHPKDVNHPQWSRKHRGPNGRGLCRICIAEVPKGKRTFCGPECIATCDIRAGRYRFHVWKRDHGICAACGHDTERREKVADLVSRMLNRQPWRDGRDSDFWGRWEIDSRGHSQTYHRIMRQWGYETHKSPWEADHIVALAEGGRNEITNLRTLCLPCHKQATADLSARLAKRRRAKRNQHQQTIEGVA